jgi:signal transduction histidine kinase
MTRRLTLAIVGTVVAALFFAGLVTLGLAAVGDRRTAERDVRAEAVDIADQFVKGNVQGGLASYVQTVRKLLRNDGIEVFLVGPAGGVSGTMPKGVPAGKIDVKALGNGTVSGHKGRLVWAAAGQVRPAARVVVVVTRRSGNGLAGATRWFVLAATATVIIAAIVASRLSRRLTRPVKQADEAARAIANGELGARVPEPAADHDDELADLARSINAMADHLERSQGLEQQFLLSVSHDLRTPLTSIRGYAEAITDGATKDPAWAASVILSEARRLERLVRDLLDLAKLQSRSFSLQLRPLDLAAAAATAAEGFLVDASDSGIAVRFQAASSGPVPVQADADRLAQVLANLIENASKYARTTVHVGAAANAGVAMVWVDDDGPGIAPADLPHVFERLYVARHEPARKESGSGLGLAIVHELVTAMGGTVVAEAAPGQGARFVVRLPLAGSSTMVTPASGSVRT